MIRQDTESIMHCTPGNHLPGSHHSRLLSCFSPVESLESQSWCFISRLLPTSISLSNCLLSKYELLHRKLLHSLYATKITIHFGACIYKSMYFCQSSTHCRNNLFSLRKRSSESNHILSFRQLVKCCLLYAKRFIMKIGLRIRTGRQSRPA